MKTHNTLDIRVGYSEVDRMGIVHQITPGRIEHSYEIWRNADNTLRKG